MSEHVPVLKDESELAEHALARAALRGGAVVIKSDLVVTATGFLKGDVRRPLAHPYYAGFARRLAAYLLDITVLLLVTALITLAAMLMWAAVTGAPDPWTTVRRIMIGPGAPLRLTHGPLTITTLLAVPASHLVPFVVFNVAAWLYFTLQESSARGATLGKRLLGLRVTDERGSPLSFVRAKARYWSKFFSDETLGLGYLLILATPRQQALHDLFARTLVVRV